MKMQSPHLIHPHKWNLPQT